MQVKRYASYYDASIDDDALDSELASVDSDGLMSKEDKAKLDSIKVGEGGSVLPVIKASDVICDDQRTFVSMEEKETWDNKADNKLACETEPGLMCPEDKIKIDSVEVGANYYVHPDTHPATSIEEDAEHRFVTDEQIASWETEKDSGVFNANTHYDFPSIGSVDVIYKAYAEQKTYQWNAEKLIYEPLNENIINVNIINGGNANGINGIND